MVAGHKKLIQNDKKSRAAAYRNLDRVRGPLSRAQQKSRVERFARGLFGIIVCIALLAVFSIGLAYFLLQGKTGQDSAITARVEQQLEVLTGNDFDVQIGQLNLDFSSVGSVFLRSDNIRIVRREDNQLLAEIGSFEVNALLLKLLLGNYNFEYARINEARLDATVLGSGQALFLPAHLNKPLDATGQTFARLYQNFSADGFESFEIYNSTIVGPVLGRRQTDPLTVDRLSIVPLDERSFSVSGLFRTEQSDIEVTSQYTTATDDAPAEYVFDASGVNLREWLEDPASNRGVVASDSVVRVSGRLPFDENHEALDPAVKIMPSSGTLRVGWYYSTQVKTAELNFRLLLDKNQIELDPSEFEAGRLKATLIGGIKPADKNSGYFGPLLYEIIMKRGEFSPTLEGEPVIPAAFKLTGIYNRERKIVDIVNLSLSTRDGAIIGSGAIGLEGETPSIKATAATNGISVIALKQFWPFFVAAGARKWLHDHIADGWISSGTFHADVPSGIIFRLWKGAKLMPEHYKAVLNVQDLKFRPFGEMPNISEAQGTVTLEGMKVSADMTDGKVVGISDEPVQINVGSFVMENFAAKKRWGEAKLELEGELGAIAEISDRKPLRVMERLKVKADQFTGEGHANIAVRFPIGRKAKYEEVDWNVLMEMQHGASKKKLDGRKLENANLLIDANSKGAKVTGTMRIDGVETRINLIEPIGKSGEIKRKREVRTTLDETGRLALGVDLKPVIEGPVEVLVMEQKGREKYTLDFTKASISLPWVGWSKGSNIPATGEFYLKRLKNGVRLEDFKVTGEGFGGSGTLTLDKRGLVSAAIKNLKLNERDDVNFELKRTKKAYEIVASGNSYDARGVINSLIHHREFAKAQGKRSVNLVASFDTVRGFENRVINNVDLIYESRQGKLRRLDLKGDGSEGRFYNILAELEGSQTRFSANTNDAGNVLAFTNIYTKMEGGVLNANLQQLEDGPYIGPIQIEDFFVVNEERLKSLAAGFRRELKHDRGDGIENLSVAEDHRVKFLHADARIERGKGYLNVDDATMHNTAIGFTMNGSVYDAGGNMNLTGTFMPANSVNLAVSAIPLLGQLFSNGRDNALIGVTYQLKGPRVNPQLVVNPLSIVTPGIFNEIFEFRQ